MGAEARNPSVRIEALLDRGDLDAPGNMVRIAIRVSAQRSDVAKARKCATVESLY
jgi:hypothetical protein